MPIFKALVPDLQPAKRKTPETFSCEEGQTLPFLHFAAFRGFDVAFGDLACPSILSKENSVHLPL